MEYPKRSANGDAGEYLAAYSLTKALGWPCRLYGVDLGVDAELEILDDQGVSRGDIVKVQIKTMQPEKTKPELAIYVDERHIDYWQRFCLPVIVCCVDLSQEKVYWRQITATEAFRSRGQSRKVTFDREVDLISPQARPLLEKLVHPAESKEILPLFQELERRFARLPQGIVRFFDLDQIVEIDSLCEDVSEVLQKLERILAFFPWRVNAFENARLGAIRDDVLALKRDGAMAAADILNGG
ncbi:MULTISPECIES: DUF4365 domain-containing protein [unclassified Rhizobacter]|uniref:DUF4365 domain-containing protein n=1 Tax=unclassified Rhizobacter TaxID=2640088 RepID=UPI000B18B0DB|nr:MULTISPECIES: DUF4365 domain-containing protein [unclassified Rhizobacter]